MSSIQDDDVVIENGAITGTLKLLETGDIADYWGDGNFMALQFVVPDGAVVRVGMDPSASGMDLQPLDEDKNGVFKVTDKDTQNFKAEVTINGVKRTFTYDLSGLTLLDS